MPHLPQSGRCQLAPVPLLSTDVDADLSLLRAAQRPSSSLLSLLRDEETGMSRKERQKLLMAFIGLVLLIVAYNVWSYATGRCTLTMLMSLSPTVKVLLAGNLFGALGLVVLKLLRRYRAPRHSVCRCGAQISGADWAFCPRCGERLPNAALSPSAGRDPAGSGSQDRRVVR